MITIVPYNPAWPVEFAEIAASLRSLEDFQPSQAALESLGYSLRPGITSDHQPPGFDGPASEWEKRYFAPPPDQRPTNLHVRVDGRLNQRYALLFRDYLRTHPPTAAAYASFNRGLLPHPV